MPENFTIPNEPPAFYTRDELLLALRTLIPAAGLVDGVTITINGSGQLQLSGTLSAALISSLDAAILTGVLPASTLPTIPWSKVEAGTLPSDRIPTIPKEKVAGVLASLIDGVVANATTAVKLSRQNVGTWTLLSGLTYGTASTTAFAHGMASVPDLCQGQFKLGAAVGGYSVDDIIPLHNVYVLQGATHYVPVSVLLDATNATVIWPLAASITLHITHKTTGAVVNLSQANVQASSVRLITALIS